MLSSHIREQPISLQYLSLRSKTLQYLKICSIALKKESFLISQNKQRKLPEYKYLSYSYKKYIQLLNELVIEYSHSEILILMKRALNSASIPMIFKGNDNFFSHCSSKRNYSFKILLAISENGKKIPALIIFQEKTG